MAFIDEMIENMQTAGKFVCEKAVDAKDYISLEYKASGLRNKIDKALKDLGALVYESYGKENQPQDKIKELVDGISVLKSELEGVNEECAKFKNVCKSCKTANPQKADFCTKCGSSLK